MLPGSGANPDTSERGGVVWVGITVASFFGKIGIQIDGIQRFFKSESWKKQKLPSVWEIQSFKNWEQ